MKVILSPNPYRDVKLRAAQAAKRILEQAGVETMVCLPFTPDDGGKLDLPPQLPLTPLDEALRQADMLICFGGDGTILHAAKDANRYQVPILGVNMGSVGFMAELESGELNLLSRLNEGKYTIEERIMLDVCVRREGKIVFTDTALNDAVVTKGAVARVIRLQVFADQDRLLDIDGDGVIVATPTGSTGYSMSAGGPVVEPTAQNFVISPICAHTIRASSYVLSTERQVIIRAVEPGKKPVFLSVDGGRAFSLHPGDEVRIKRSKYETELVRLTNRGFSEILESKMLGGCRHEK